MKLFVKCEEANHSCDKNQYNEATFWEKVLLNVHLIYCAACRKYSSRNGKLSKTMHKGDIKTMPKTDKEQLKKQLRQEMAKH